VFSNFSLEYTSLVFGEISLSTILYISMLFLFKCITAEEKGWLHDLISVQNDGHVKINDKKIT
jgi:hypothetical protein